MMHITKLTTSPFKGQSINLKLKPMNLIHGDNLSGKTSVPDAIKVGTLGYVPKVGKTEQLTFSLSSDPDQLNVQIEFDDGSTNYAVFTRSKDGRVSRRTTFDVQTPAVMMDFTDYIKRTEQDKMQYVLSCIDPALVKYSDKDLLAELKKIEALPTEVAIPICREAVKKVEVIIKERKASNVGIPEFLGTMIETFKRQKKNANETAKQKQASLSTLAQQSREAEPVIEPPSRQEMGELAGQIQNLRGEIDRRPRDFEVEVRRMNRALSDLESDLKSCRQLNERYEAEAEEVSKAVECPTCKADGKGWRKTFAKAHDLRMGENAKSIKSTESQIRVLEKKRDSEQAQADVYHSLEVALSEKKTAYDLLKQRLESSQAVKQSSTELRNQLEAESVKAVVEATVMDSFIKAFTEAQEQLVASTFGSLLEVAREFTTAFFRAPLEYRSGDLGYMRGKTWVSWRTFSGAEELFAFAGFCIALCHRLKFRLVVLDEFGRLKPKMKVLMVGVLKKLIVNKVIDQVIIIDVDTRDYSAVKDDLNIIEIEDNS